MAPKGTINLGFVKAIHSGVNPPLNKKMIWYDENEFVHKVWDVITETWDYIKVNSEKQCKLSSYDESILIENDGNIESNVSLFEEYFNQQECELNFTPIQIIGVYQDGIKLLKSEYEIILPKKIKIKEYVDENIQIEYTHLKS